MEEPENSLCNSLGVRSYEPWGQKSHRRCQAHVLGITYTYSSCGIYSKRAREEVMFDQVCGDLVACTSSHLQEFNLAPEPASYSAISLSASTRSAASRRIRVASSVYSNIFTAVWCSFSFRPFIPT